MLSCSRMTSHSLSRMPHPLAATRVKYGARDSPLQAIARRSQSFRAFLQLRCKTRDIRLRNFSPDSSVSAASSICSLIAAWLAYPLSASVSPMTCSCGTAGADLGEGHSTGRRKRLRPATPQSTTRSCVSHEEFAMRSTPGATMEALAAERNLDAHAPSPEVAFFPERDRPAAWGASSTSSISRAQ